MLWSTRIRERVRLQDPIEAWRFVDRLAAALHQAGMGRDDAAELYALAERRTDRADGDPTGLFFHLVGGPWRRTIDDLRSRRREAAARRKGAAAASRDATRAGRTPDPIPIGDVLAGLLRAVRRPG